MESEARPFRTAGRRHRSKLYAVIGLTGTYLVAEVVGSILTGSLALLADAGFMFTDLVALSLALVAIKIAERAATQGKTFGYARAEVLAALANALLMGGICAYILYEAYERFRHPREVLGGWMMAVAVVGLGVNLTSVLLLRAASKESINLRGAYLEVLGDMLGSVAVIAGGLIILLTGWRLVDPILSAGIGLFILPRAWGLMKETVDILMEGTPKRLDMGKLRARIESIAGVVGSHDLHAWTITSGILNFSGHVVVKDAGRIAAVLSEAHRALREEFGIAHTTLQIEPQGFEESNDTLHS